VKKFITAIFMLSIGNAIASDRMSEIEMIFPLNLMGIILLMPILICFVCARFTNKHWFYYIAGAILLVEGIWIGGWTLGHIFAGQLGSFFPVWILFGIALNFHKIWLYVATLLLLAGQLYTYFLLSQSGL